MRINELFQVLAGVTATLMLATFPESVRCDHSVHLRIHVPEIVQKHKHVKTKYVHVYHPKIISSDVHHSPSLSFYSRKDPNSYDVVTGSGYASPAFKQQKNELKFTANDFYRWRQDQAKKSIADHHSKRNVKPSIHENDDDDDDDDNGNAHDLNRDLDDDQLDESERYSSSNHDNLYKTTKGNSPPKHKNHKYHQQDHYTTSNEKSYANYSNRHQWNNKRKPTKQQSSPHQHQNDRTRKTKSNSKSRHKYQQPQLYTTLESQQQPQYLKSEVRPDVDVNDPTFYSTLPKNTQVNPAADHDDDIYSGLLSMKPSKLIADKSKLLADINYNRKQQTKIFTAQHKIQKQGELLSQS